MVAVIVTPILVVLIVQVAAFPVKLHQYEIKNKVMLSTSISFCILQHLHASLKLTCLPIIISQHFTRVLW